MYNTCCGLHLYWLSGVVPWIFTSFILMCNTCCGLHYWLSGVVPWIFTSFILMYNTCCGLHLYWLSGVVPWIFTFLGLPQNMTPLISFTNRNHPIQCPLWCCMLVTWAMIFSLFCKITFNQGFWPEVNDFAELEMRIYLGVIHVGKWNNHDSNTNLQSPASTWFPRCTPTTLHCKCRDVCPCQGDLVRPLCTLYIALDTWAELL
jgi:hypothetical protein